MYVCPGLAQSDSIAFPSGTLCMQGNHVWKVFHLYNNVLVCPYEDRPPFVTLGKGLFVITAQYRTGLAPTTLGRLYRPFAVT